MLAVVDIGDMSGYGDEGELRYELHQADQSKIQRRAGALVHFPSHGGFLHLQAEDKDEIADEVAPIRGNPECRVGVMSRWGTHCQDFSGFFPSSATAEAYHAYLALSRRGALPMA